MKKATAAKTGETEMKEETAVGTAVSEYKCQQCLDAALRLLDYRPRSRAEMTQRLARRFPPDIVGATLVELASRGLVDDGEFARYWKGNRSDFRPRSRRMLAMELRRKGIAGDVIDEALADADDDENAYRAAVAKAGHTSFADDEDFRRRLGGYLRRRGFNYETIRGALERILRER